MELKFQKRAIKTHTLNRIKKFLPNAVYRKMLPFGKMILRVVDSEAVQPGWSNLFTPTERQLIDAVYGCTSKLTVEKPEVSVIIPVYNEFQHTLRAVWSVLFQGRSTIEIIIVDDVSSDQTQDFFSSLPQIKYIRNDTNIGFLENCNKAAKQATGEFLYFLNNDTFVQENAIDLLVATLKQDEMIGLAGSKLIYPDGTLQEMGGIVWRDATGANFGRNQPAYLSHFEHLREVDYCSGAAIMLRKSIWFEVGGFDPRYRPAYYEDTDLSFSLRLAGLKVVCNPKSIVSHLEGVSSGTDLNHGVKKYQTENRDKFINKWQYQLELHQPNSSVDFNAYPHPRKPQVLFIDSIVPEPDKDAGSVVAYNYILILQSLGFSVTFMATNLSLNGGYGDNLRHLGVEVITAPETLDLERYITTYHTMFTLFFLCRHNHGGRFAQLIKSLNANNKIIFNTCDLHHLREEREGLHKKNKQLIKHSSISKKSELGCIRTSDKTIVISEFEKDYLSKIGLKDKISLIPLIYETTFSPDRDNTNIDKIGFIGGYRHTPNVDAVDNFILTTMPKLVAKHPNIEFHIIGSNPPKHFKKYENKNIKLVGFVEDLEAYVSDFLCTVAPLNYGAGIKGKIASSLAIGVPCVASNCAVEGMNLVDSEEILVANNPEEFASLISLLRSDDELRKKLEKNGIQFCENNYSLNENRIRLARTLKSIGFDFNIDDRVVSTDQVAARLGLSKKNNIVSNESIEKNGAQINDEDVAFIYINGNFNHDDFCVESLDINKQYVIICDPSERNRLFKIVRALEVFSWAVRDETLALPIPNPSGLIFLSIKYSVSRESAPSNY